MSRKSKTLLAAAVLHFAVLASLVLPHSASAAQKDGCEENLGGKPNNPLAAAIHGASKEEQKKLVSAYVKEKTSYLIAKREEAIARFYKLAPPLTAELVRVLREQDESRKGGFSVGTPETKRLLDQLTAGIDNDPITTAWPKKAKDQLGFFVRVSGRSTLGYQDAILTAWHMANDPRLSAEAKEMLDIVQSDFLEIRALYNAFEGVYWGTVDIGIDNERPIEALYQEAVKKGLIKPFDYAATAAFIDDQTYLRAYGYGIIKQFAVSIRYAWLTKEALELERKKGRAFGYEREQLEKQYDELSKITSAAYTHAEGLSLQDFIKNDINSPHWLTAYAEAKHNYYEPALTSVDDLLKAIEKIKRNE